MILRRHEKKEIKSKLNAAALPLAIAFGAEIIQECFEFQLLLQRRFGSTLFGIQATAQSREHQQLSSTAHGVHQTLPFLLASQGNCINLDTPKKPFQLITTHLPKIDAERRATAMKQPQSLTQHCSMLLLSTLFPTGALPLFSTIGQRAFIPIFGLKAQGRPEQEHVVFSSSQAQGLHQPHPSLISCHCQNYRPDSFSTKPQLQRYNNAYSELPSPDASLARHFPTSNSSLKFFMNSS